MRTGTPQAERIVHRLGFLSQGFANSVGLSASGSIWRQIIISWKNILALQWKAAVWSSLTSHWLKNFAPVVGGKRNVLKWHLFMLNFACLWWNKSMKSVAYGPTQQKVRIQMRKGLNGLSSYFTTWEYKGLSFVGPEKITQKKRSRKYSPDSECFTQCGMQIMLSRRRWKYQSWLRGSDPLWLSRCFDVSWTHCLLCTRS